LKTASALPLVAVTAHQALFTGGHYDKLGDITSDSKILILGGATSVGAIAIQLAAAKGAKVYTTASTNAMPDGTSKMDWCTSLCAEAIDYKKKDWSEDLKGADLDMIFDLAGDNKDWQNAPKVLKPGSKFISVSNFAHEPAEQPGAVFQVFAKKSDLKDLDCLVELARQEKLKVAIDSVTPLSEVQAALTTSFRGKATGKLVIDIGGEP